MPDLFAIARRRAPQTIKIALSLIILVALFSPIGEAYAEGHYFLTFTQAGSDDFNRQIYYKNKLELGFGISYVPKNVPMLFDPLRGNKFARSPWVTDYTILPMSLALRWQVTDIIGRYFWRGNVEAGIGPAFMFITKGPESFYAAIITGARYNFVQPNWRIAPYAEANVGLGWTNAQQPYEVMHNLPRVGQGQDFTFTFSTGAGLRYNINRDLGVSVGICYLHISNAYLSEPKYKNYGINLVGPSFGFVAAIAPMVDCIRTQLQSTGRPPRTDADSPRQSW